MNIPQRNKPFFFCVLLWATRGRKNNEIPAAFPLYINWDNKKVDVNEFYWLGFIPLSDKERQLLYSVENGQQ